MQKIMHDLSRYNNHGCRCDLCKTANRLYQRAYQKRKKAALAARRETALAAGNKAESST